MFDLASAELSSTVFVLKRLELDLSVHKWLHRSLVLLDDDLLDQLEVSLVEDLDDRIPGSNYFLLGVLPGNSRNFSF